MKESFLLLHLNDWLHLVVEIDGLILDEYLSRQIIQSKNAFVPTKKR